MSAAQNIGEPMTEAYEQWRELYDTFTSLSDESRVAVLGFARGQVGGAESVHTIGLGGAFDEVNRVIGFNQTKHPLQKWRTYTVAHHVGKLLGHAAKFIRGEQLDQDTKRHALAHVAARSLMALQLELEKHCYEMQPDGAVTVS